MTLGRRSLILVPLLALILAGCGGQPVDLDDAASSHPALADGEVTYDEYQEAFRSFSSCMSRAGYELVIHGEENQTIDFSVPSGAVESGVDQQCYDDEFAAVDAAWQLSRIDTSESARILRSCLEGLGIVPAETFAEMNEQLFDSGNDPSVCSDYS